MRLQQISFEAILDEETVSRLISDELKSKFPETSSLDIPVVGEVLVEIINVTLEQFRFEDGRIVNQLSIDLKVSPVWPNVEVAVVGKLDVELKIQINLNTSDLIQTEIIISKFDWQTGPSLAIWNREFNLWLVKKMTEWQKSNIGEAVDKLIEDILVPENLSKSIAQQLRPVRISDQLSAHINDIKLNLQTLQIESGRLKVSGEIDARIEFLQDLHRICQSHVKLEHSLPDHYNDIVHVIINTEEVNLVLGTFIKDLNEEVLRSKNLISRISVATVEESLRVTMVPVRMKQSSLFMTISMEFEEVHQQLHLNDIKVRTNKDAGFVVKALTFTLRGTIEKMIKKKFPLDMTPLLHRMAHAIEGEGPESLHIEVDPISIKKIHFSGDEIESTFNMRIRMRTDASSLVTESS